MTGKQRWNLIREGFVISHVKDDKDKLVIINKINKNKVYVREESDIYQIEGKDKMGFFALGLNKDWNRFKNVVCQKLKEMY
jgi:hypothetical protein